MLGLGFLRLADGNRVLVRAAQLLPGGLLLFGIPAFKLDKEVVERRVNILKQQGVEFKVGVTVGKDVTLALDCALIALSCVEHAQERWADRRRPL